MYSRLLPPSVAAIFSLASLFPLWADGAESAKVTLTGQVVDEDNKPILGATVQPLAWKAPDSPLLTDRDGRFSVPTETVAGGYVSYAFLARAKDGRLGFAVVETVSPEQIRIVLKAARKLNVAVQDQEGNAVQGAEVLFLSDMRLLQAGMTDARGSLDFQVPSDCHGWAVLSRKSQLGFDYRTAERGRTSKAERHPLPEQLKLRLNGARTVRVKTVDQTGKPVAGVKVGPWYLRKPGYEADINLSGVPALRTQTDANGLAIVDWLPEKFEQSLPFTSQSDDYYPREHSSSINAEKPAGEVTIELLPLERLSGRVMHADGRPAAGMGVTIRGQGTSNNGFHGTTQTDKDGRYQLKAYSEQAYLVRAGDEKFATPCRGDIIVHAGQAMDGIDLVLGPATRVKGRVTVGKNNQPVANYHLNAILDKGAIPKDLLRKADDRYYYGLQMYFGAQTDSDGRYQVFLGPGEYQIAGPARTESVKLTIPSNESPSEIVQDFHMPRAESGPLAGQVVDSDGKSVPGAVVEGRYAASDARRWFGVTKTDEQGKFQIERSLDPLIIHARNESNTLAGIVKSDSEETETKVVIGPIARATGRLLDLEGKPVKERELTYGIRVYTGEPLRSPFMDSFGGKVTTDADGNFALSGLIPGKSYQLNVKIDEHSSRTVTQVTAKEANSLSLGDLSVDPKPTQPYVPPTPAQRTAEAFAAKKEMPLAERLQNLYAEARREYTRPLLLFGNPADPACIELFRLFQERGEGDTDKKDYRAPNELRWEFELAALNVDRPEVRELAAKLKIDLANTPPVLAVLNSDGALIETQSVELQEKKLDPRLLGGWMERHKLPTRDAQKMLDDALAQAKAEDKRVFFIFSASWCGPCRMLARFLAPHKSELEKHFVFVKLDVSRDEHAEELRERFKESASGGVPWYCILDSESKVLATSNMPEVNPKYGTSNMGFPTEPPEVEHFVGLLQKTAPHLPADKLAEFKAELLKKK